MTKYEYKINYYLKAVNTWYVYTTNVKKCKTSNLITVVNMSKIPNHIMKK